MSNYEHQAYPKALYRRAADGALETALVADADAQAALGDEWGEHPDHAAVETVAAEPVTPKSDKRKKSHGA